MLLGSATLQNIFIFIAVGSAHLRGVVNKDLFSSVEDLLSLQKCPACMFYKLRSRLHIYLSESG